MATYPEISTLSGLNGSPGLSNPADADDISELAASVRQLKSFLYTYLGTSHADDGTLDTGSVPIASIGDRTITAVKIVLKAITEAEIADATITSAKIANLAITTALLNDLAVTAGKIAADAVTTAKILDANVTEAKIASGAVTETKLGAGAVTSTKLGASAVGNSNIAANAVSTDKLANIGDSKLLVGNGSDTTACDVGGALTATRSGSTLVFSIAGGSSASSLILARLVETAVSGTHGGATTAGSWENRGSTVSWDKSGQDAGSMVTLSTYKFLLKKGTYYIRATIPAYSCGSFKTRLLEDPAGTPATILLGSNGAAPAGSIGVSVLCGSFSVAVDDTAYCIQQYSEIAETNGMGLAQSIASVNEVYSVLELIRYA